MDTLFFLASKTFWLLLRPESWIVILLLTAAIAHGRGRRRSGQRLLVTSLLSILAIGTLPLGEALLSPLETRFPPQPDVGDPAGIIVLGGGEHAAAMAVSGLPEVNDAADRFLAGLALARQYPEARLIFTGGSAALLGERPSGAEVALRIFQQAGIPAERIVLESAARNTAENASLTHALIDDPGPGPWILVTSAFHMPRAIGSFCRAGWRGLVAYPVDYRSSGSRIGWDLAERLRTLNIAVKEWVGLAAYILTGRTRSLVPGPC